MARKYRTTPAKGTFTEKKERAILAQRKTISKYDILDEDSSLFCHWIVFKNPACILP